MDDFVANALEKIILISLGGPGGDPDYCHLTAAAHAYAALEKMGKLKEEDEGFKEFCEFNMDFMERARQGKSY